ncbi:nitroreductase family deazaflavin-dependent oxidoreductase [Nocardia sp. CA-128927]|uniref:nitroreductase family deazaflavin-dependent oxidoreductase n=1 Tax=Nocardia sp. CA-128927 TaxID=3239975 RepID=UPI003D99D261
MTGQNDNRLDAAKTGSAGVPAQPRRNPFLRSAHIGRRLNQLQLPFFQVMAPKGFGVLTTTGRKTGMLRRNCVRVIRDGDKAYLVMVGPAIYRKPREKATADWLRNIRVNPGVRLRLRGGTVSGSAREFDDPAELERARQRYCETVNAFNYAECCFHRSGWPSRQKIQGLHSHWFSAGIPVVVDLE